MRILIAFFMIVLNLAGNLIAREKSIVTIPSGATIKILNPGRESFPSGIYYTSNTKIDFPSRREPYQLEISLDGHETQIVTYDYRNDNDKSAPIQVVLEKILEKREVFFESNPSGAEVVWENHSLGTTPLKTILTFRRETARSAWKPCNIVVQKPHYQSETLSIGLQDVVPIVQLAALRREIEYHVVVTTNLGEPLNALVSVDGQEQTDKSPLTVKLVYQRENKDQPWNEHTIKAQVPGIYQPDSKNVTLDTAREINFALIPITEAEVIRYFPKVEQTPRGARIQIDKSSSIGTYDIKDNSSPAIDLRRVTNFQRETTQLQSVNSYCVTPDGLQVVYSVTQQNEQNEFYANLFIKSSNDQNYAFTQITRGIRFYDTNPTMCREEGSNLVVFQSNRGPIDSFDISSLRLKDSRVVGGIQQITRDSRFNYYPTFTSEKQPIFFASLENYPRAEPMISFVRSDGSSFTTLGEVGEQLNRAESGTIYFVRKAEDTGKLQIYSVSSEGLSFSTVINDAESAKSNCFHPSISADGSKLLFVSDYHKDEKGRHNNNIYVYNLETARIQQLTDNGSDDIQPQWSPTESGVIFFLSNRGGVYNIWRMTVVNLD